MRWLYKYKENDILRKNFAHMAKTATLGTENIGIDFMYTGSLADVANIIVALSILIGGLMAVFFIFFAGIQFITSGGDEEKTRKAVVSIRYAIIGLLVVIFSVTFVAILGSLFNFDLVPFIYWDKMRFIMQSLVQQYAAGSTLVPPPDVSGSVGGSLSTGGDIPTYSGTPPPGVIPPAVPVGEK